MEKKPVNFVVKNPKEAAKRLNEIVEKGGHNFDVGVNNEYVTTVTKNSDGSTTSEKERVYRIIGFVDMYVGEELDSLNAVKDDLKKSKKKREELNRTLNIMNKSAFAPISILLLCVAIFTLVFGILTVAKVLPLPSNQLPIAIVLIIVGVLALAGSILLFIFRKKKKEELLSRKEEILAEDEKLKAEEQEIDRRIPQWYKDTIWSESGDKVVNSYQQLVLEREKRK